jgi:Sgf11 (transcriptional regulation protein)
MGDVICDQVVDAVLNDILEHITTDVACELHRAIKMGKLKPGPKRRLDLYPTVHANEEAMLELLQKYATEESIKERASILADDVLFDVDEQEEQEETSPAPIVVVTRHQQNQTDIWNRIPPKEPKKLAKCTICDREVSVLRFAPHLDKCMQLGTARAASANHTTVSNGRGAAK